MNELKNDFSCNLKLGLKNMFFSQYYLSYYAKKCHFDIQYGLNI